MKKILIASKNMNIGGVEKSLLSLLGTISPNEYEIDLLLLENYGGFMDSIPSWVNVMICDEYNMIKDEVNLPPIKVIINHLKKGHFARAFSLTFGYARFKLFGDNSYYYKSVFKIIPKRTKHYDVAISYTSIISYLSWYVNYHVVADKKIGWIHFDISKLPVDHNMMLLLHKNMCKIYVVSRQAMNAFTREFPQLSDKCELRYNVVDHIAIRKLADEKTERIREEGIVTIVTLGRLSSEKGQDIVPEIAHKLKEKGLRFKWYLIGDGNLRSTIEDSVKRFAVEDFIVLLGTKANPYPYLKQADCYVQTSVHEGYCITLAEAKAFDLPIVSTDFAGALEQLDGREKSIITQRDVTALADAIETLIEKGGLHHA